MAALLQDPTFWTLVAFIVFVIALFKPVKKALIGGLDSRIAQVRSEVEQAQELREEAQALLDVLARMEPGDALGDDAGDARRGQFVGRG